MTRVKIKDLPKDAKISKQEMKHVLGGGSTVPVPDRSFLMIGTWPTPERPSVLRPTRRDWLRIDTVPLPE